MDIFKVLEEISSKEYASKEQMSRELGISKEEVELALQALEDLGYIRRINPNCNVKYCSSCPFRNTCNMKVELYEVRREKK
ncbi:MAG: winged helix-turn-helix transcriptional regulator [Thermoproteota archaeon]